MVSPYRAPSSAQAKWQLYSDMTKREEVTRAYLEICNELPPIAGVAQGASEYFHTTVLQI